MLPYRYLCISLGVEKVEALLELQDLVLRESNFLRHLDKLGWKKTTFGKFLETFFFLQDKTSLNVNNYPIFFKYESDIKIKLLNFVM